MAIYNVEGSREQDKKRGIHGGGEDGDTSGDESTRRL